jgi:hypothetical protein
MSFGSAERMAGIVWFQNQNQSTDKDPLTRATANKTNSWTWIDISESRESPGGSRRGREHMGNIYPIMETTHT